MKYHIYGHVTVDWQVGNLKGRQADWKLSGGTDTVVILRQSFFFRDISVLLLRPFY